MKKWYIFPIDIMVKISLKLGDMKFFLECSYKSGEKMYSGGNMWSAGVDFISFFRHIAKLPLDYSKWDDYEALAEMSGPRFMHEKFCIICDRPSILLVDDQNRPHCEDGPFCEWRDGSALYSWHGVRVPAYVIETPEVITLKSIKEESNQEVKRVMIERYGVSKYLMDIGAKIIDMDSLTLEGSAPRALMEDDTGDKYLIGSDGSTARIYHMRVDSNIKTCRESHNLLAGFDESLLIAES